MRKNAVFAIIFVFGVVVALFLGIGLGWVLNSVNDGTPEKADNSGSVDSEVNSNEDAVAKHDGLVGVYESNTWNGKIGTIILYADGTCKYPSGGGVSWELKGDTVVMTVMGRTYGESEVLFNVYFEDWLTEDDCIAMYKWIKQLPNVDSAEMRSPNHVFVKLSSPNNNITYDAIYRANGVSNIEFEIVEMDEEREYEATIMESGLVLHGHYFRKISN